MSKPDGKANSIQLIVRIAGSVLTLALLIYVLKKQEKVSQTSWHDILVKITHIPWWILLTVCLLMLISRLAVGGRWHVLLKAAGADISIWRSVQLTFAGLFASNFLPTTVGGDVVRLAGAMRYKCDSSSCVASLVLDRLVGMIGMILALPIMIPVFLDLGSLRQHVPPHLPALGLAVGGGQGKWREKIGRAMAGILSALKQGVRRPKSLLMSLLLTGVHMACFFTIIYLLLQGMGEHTSFVMCAGLWSVVYFVTLIPIGINGWGVQELSIQQAFTRVAMVSPEHGLILALFMRLFTMLASLPGAVFLPSLMPDVRRQSITAVPEPERTPAGVG